MVFPMVTFVEYFESCLAFKDIIIFIKSLLIDEILVLLNPTQKHPKSFYPLNLVYLFLRHSLIFVVRSDRVFVYKF